MAVIKSISPPTWKQCLPASARSTPTPTSRRTHAPTISCARLPAAELEARIQDFSRTYLAGIAVEFDGARVSPVLESIGVPDKGDLQRARLSTLLLAGTVPAGAREFRWTYAPEFGSSVLRLQKQGREGMAAFWLKEGAGSEPYPLTGEVKTMARGEVVQQYTALGSRISCPRGWIIFSSCSACFCSA